MASALIEVRDVWKIYELGDVAVQALRGVSVDIAAGEFVAVMGASGSGKSTFMNIVGCLDRPTRGVYRLAGTDVSTLDDLTMRFRGVCGAQSFTFDWPVEFIAGGCRLTNHAELGSQAASPNVVAFLPQETR